MDTSEQALMEAVTAVIQARVIRFWETADWSEVLAASRDDDSEEMGEQFDEVLGSGSSKFRDDNLKYDITVGYPTVVNIALRQVPSGQLFVCVDEIETGFTVFSFYLLYDGTTFIKEQDDRQGIGPYLSTYLLQHSIKSNKANVDNLAKDIVKELTLLRYKITN